jgi:hypothetical protein
MFQGLYQWHQPPLKQPDGALTRSDSFLPIASNPTGHTPGGVGVSYRGDVSSPDFRKTFGFRLRKNARGENRAD